MNEEWRDIVGYEGLYQVSSLGNIKSLPELKRTDGRFIRKGEIMKLTPRSRKRQNEYLCVGINRKVYAVHR
ncbi:NUMOD4 domain-containing protein, partial [Arthrobacter sp. PsM3]|uniref:NUMOD4 domain-containing protein n=1 Tax=Arthrobacter sp. PsM3 TaxID=3030531 RepID=UPI00263B2B23